MILTEQMIRDAMAAIRAQGPCLVCGVPGEYAAHRLIDAQQEIYSRGASPSALGDEYGAAVAGVLAKWIALRIVMLQDEIAAADAAVVAAERSAEGLRSAPAMLGTEHGSGPVSSEAPS